MAQEFAKIEEDRILNHTNSMNRIVYDCIDQSPYYESGTYIDENDQIEIPMDETLIEKQKYLFAPVSNI